MTSTLAEFGRLLVFDLAFVGLLLLLIVPIAIWRKAAYAVLKRNFKGYFSNPTGYVFLCLFVALASLAAFWPNEFFTTNLANLDQLNKYFPFIMLVFIPAITMGIWAEERRQGTDELLLTLPAEDLDIVLGKYLAAAATFTVSLIFSQLANFMVLVSLAGGELDTGLFFTTYMGYWLMGLTMLSLGMVASFLTNNLTVSFILGAAFNAPLVFAVYANVIVPDGLGPHFFSRWSFAERFDDFGRGVISTSATSYFVLIIILGIYLSLVFIGRRHWLGGRDGSSLIGHYLIRTLALIGIVVAVNVLFSNHDVVRLDSTEGKSSSLSEDTKKLLSALKTKKGSRIKVEAFISARVPDEYIKTRYNLISMLKELESYGGSSIELKLNSNLEEFSKEASLAEETYGIKRQQVISQSRGEIRQEQFIMGAAFTYGLERVVVPFFTTGTPVEFEIVRGVTTVAQAQRKRIGVVATDAQLKGGFSFAGGQPQQIPKALFLEELERQYRVDDVDLKDPLQVFSKDGELLYDALLVVQPSSLGPQQLANLVAAIKQGQPMAIFEDPLPQMFGGVVGTADDKPSPGGMFGGGQPQPKGDFFKEVWSTLEIEPVGNDKVPGKLRGNVVCQNYMPYRKFAGNMPELGPLVFVGGPGGKFNPAEPVAKNFQELFLPFPGGIRQQKGDRKLEFTWLVKTSDQQTCLVDSGVYRRGGDPGNLRNKAEGFNQEYTLAAWIRGSAAEGEKKKADDTSADKPADDKAASDKTAAKKGDINVIYVCDIDILSNQFAELRNSPPPGETFRWNNIPFVMNVIDAVANDPNFLALRQREPRYFTLRQIEAVTAVADENVQVQEKKFKEENQKEEAKEDDEVKKLEADLQAYIESVRKKSSEGNPVPLSEQLAKVRSLQLKAAVRTAAASDKKQALKRSLEKQVINIGRERDKSISRVQNWYKMYAALIPPILPLLMGLVVFVSRFIREREGISKTRMR